MDVEDPPLKLAEHARPDDPHVPGEHDDVSADACERFGKFLVLAPRQEGRIDPLLCRPVERGTRPVREDEHEVAAELATRRRGVQGLQVGPGPRHTRRDARSPAPALGAHATDSSDPSLYRAPSRRSVSTTSPTTAAGTWRVSRVLTVVAMALGGTTSTIPRPPLKVARSSPSSRPPSAPNSRWTDGIDQRFGSSLAPRGSGRARGTLPGIPPPVMCAAPRMSWPSSASAARTARSALA